MVMRTSIWFLILCFIFIPRVQAASPWLAEKKYDQKIAHKFSYGLTNIFFGWTEIFYEPLKAAKREENALIGTGKGILHAVGITLGGALHLLTFPVPIDIPLFHDGIGVDSDSN